MTMFRLLCEMSVLKWLRELGAVKMDRARIIELDRHENC